MKKKLGDRPATGKLSTNNYFSPGTNLWVITYTPDMIQVSPDFEMYHAAIRGPGGYFLVYLDNKLYGIGENGLINEYSPKGDPMYVRDSQIITLNWSIGSGAAPLSWIYLQSPEETL
jgi:hypothetical protein